jgi:hypothetical protein
MVSSRLPRDWGYAGREASLQGRMVGGPRVVRGAMRGIMVVVVVVIMMMVLMGRTMGSVGRMVSGLRTDLASVKASACSSCAVS